MRYLNLKFSYSSKVRPKLIRIKIDFFKKRINHPKQWKLGLNGRNLCPDLNRTLENKGPIHFPAPLRPAPSQTCPFIFRRIFSENQFNNSRPKSPRWDLIPSTLMAVNFCLKKYQNIWIGFQGIFHFGTAAGRFLEVTGLAAAEFVVSEKFFWIIYSNGRRCSVIWHCRPTVEHSSTLAKLGYCYIFATLLLAWEIFATLLLTCYICATSLLYHCY